MEQADVRAILTEVRNLKTELKEFMSGHTTEVRLGKMNEDMLAGQKSSKTTIIMTAGTVIAGLLSTMVVLLIKMPI
jgi:hypothetical protein